MAKVRIKYNHYDNEFPLSAEGTVSWEQIDDEYCISFVFNGDYTVRLEGSDGKCLQLVDIGEGGKVFQGLVETSAYELFVQEDEEAGYGNEALSRDYCPPDKQTGQGLGTGGASARLTAELKGLSEAELRAQTDKYKQLKEARDLEDVLYSG